MTVGFRTGQARTNSWQTWWEGIQQARAECGLTPEEAAVVPVQQFDVFRFEVPCAELVS